MSGWLELLLLLLALVAIAAFGLDLGRGWLRNRRQREHLERLAEGSADDSGTAADDRLAVPPGRVERRLRAAGIGIGPAVVASALVLLAVLIGLGVLRAFPGAFFAAALAAFLAVALPWSLLGAWARWRVGRFEEKLVDAVGFMASALEAGENPLGALATAADAAEPPAAAALDGVVRQLAAGSSIERALTLVIRGYDSEGTRLFTQTLIAKWRAGGDLAPILQRVAQLMRERLAMRLRLKSEMAGARISAVIVAVLPYCVLPVMLWRRPDWIRVFFEHPLGTRMIFVALLLQLLGFLWLRRLFRIEGVRLGT